MNNFSWCEALLVIVAITVLVKTLKDNYDRRYKGKR